MIIVVFASPKYVLEDRQTRHMTILYVVCMCHALFLVLEDFGWEHLQRIVDRSHNLRWESIRRRVYIFGARSPSQYSGTELDSPLNPKVWVRVVPLIPGSIRFFLCGYPIVGLIFVPPSWFPLIRLPIFPRPHHRWVDFKSSTKKWDFDSQIAENSENRNKKMMDWSKCAQTGEEKHIQHGPRSSNLRESSTKPSRRTSHPLSL
jgi:hypothetical protein